LHGASTTEREERVAPKTGDRLTGYGVRLERVPGFALGKPLDTQEASDRVASDPERPRNLVDTDTLLV
jgi:hypothetical protein